MIEKNSQLISGQNRAHLNNLQALRIPFGEAGGRTLEVELRMRIIGESNQLVPIKLKAIVNEAKKNKKTNKKESDEYWDCKLYFLDQAIIEVFYNKLEEHELQKIKEFRTLRNKLVHGDFAGLMIHMDMQPTGQQLFRDGNRNLLTNADLVEMSLSLTRNQCLEKFRQLADEVIVILDNLIADWCKISPVYKPLPPNKG